MLKFKITDQELNELDDSVKLHYKPFEGKEGCFVLDSDAAEAAEKLLKAKQNEVIEANLLREELNELKGERETMDNAEYLEEMEKIKKELEEVKKQKEAADAEAERMKKEAEELKKKTVEVKKEGIFEKISANMGVPVKTARKLFSDNVVFDEKEQEIKIVDEDGKEYKDINDFSEYVKSNPEFGFINHAQPAKKSEERVSFGVGSGAIQDITEGSDSKPRVLNMSEDELMSYFHSIKG